MPKEILTKKLNSFRQTTQSPIFYQGSQKFGIPSTIGVKETNQADFMVGAQSSFMKIGNLQKSVQKPNAGSNKNPSVRIDSHKIKMQKNELIYKVLKDPFDTQDEPSVDSITFENVDINKSDLNN